MLRQMRITGGKARGIPLKCPPGDQVRPATDRMREAVFSSLGQLVEGSSFADLFAGTGSYGLEALSRGAAAGVFIEQDPRTLQLLQQNMAAVCKSCGAAASVLHCTRADVLKWTPAGGFDLIFADPPYLWSRQHLPRLLEAASIWLNPTAEARLILEIPADIDIGHGWTTLRTLGGKGRDAPTVRILAVEP